MRLLCTLLSTALLIPAIHAAGLNDTGQTSCYNAVDVSAACSAAVGGDAGTNPRQDARYGRDVQAAVGTLSKVGAGAAGFDFTKIANNGTTLPASAALGIATTSWACTKDNVTGLIWEVKTASGLRSSAHTYTWYSTKADNGGDSGTLGSNTCGGSLNAAPFNGRCNTQHYVAAVNANTVALCGATDWRLPTQRELLSIVHAGTDDPSIDPTYFPNTVSSWHWTASTFVSYPYYAWTVYFGHGHAFGSEKSLNLGRNYAVRLVRGGL